MLASDPQISHLAPAGIVMRHCRKGPHVLHIAVSPSLVVLHLEKLSLLLASLHLQHFLGVFSV
jgi:hypothetical protein